MGFNIKSLFKEYKFMDIKKKTDSVQVSYWNGHLTITTKKLRPGEINFAPIETPNEALIIKKYVSVKNRIKKSLFAAKRSIKEKRGASWTMGPIKICPGRRLLLGRSQKRLLHSVIAELHTRTSTELSLHHGDPTSNNLSLLWIDLAPISQLCTFIDLKMEHFIKWNLSIPLSLSLTGNYLF